MTAASRPRSPAATTATAPVTWPVTAPTSLLVVAVVDVAEIARSVAKAVVAAVETVVVCLAITATRADTFRATARMVPSRAIAAASSVTSAESAPLAAAETKRSQAAARYEFVRTQLG